MHSVPIAFTSPRYRELELGPFRVTDAWFVPGSTIERHYHDRPNLAVMLDGSFQLRFSSGTHGGEIDAGVCFTEPAGETHCNCVRCAGAHVLAIQPDPSDSEFVRPFRTVLERPWRGSDPVLLSLARRASIELTHEDEFARTTALGLLLELFARAGRLATEPEKTLPRWLEGVRDVLALPPGPGYPRIDDLARTAGVHPAHLAKSFRRYFGTSIGSYLLERRLEWAALELVETDRSIAAIALAAGFADQSHFTRRFRARTGRTPARLRAAARGHSRPVMGCRSRR